MDISKRLLLTAASGGLLIACFPFPDQGWLAYFALTPFLYVAYKSGPGFSFLAGWLAGTIFFGGLCYWVAIYGAVPYLLMAAGIGLLFGVASAAISYISASLKKLAPERFIWCLRPLAVSLVWVALEIIRSETGVYSFPYGTAGLTQHAFSPVVALAAIGGVYGISYLVVLINGLLVEIWLAGRASGSKRVITIAAVAAVVLATGLGVGWFIKDKTTADSNASYRISIIQPSIPQNEKWLAGKRSSTMARYERLVRQAALSRPDLIVLPEAALPAYVYDDDPLYRELSEWASSTGTPILAGVPLLTEDGAYNTVRLFDRYGRTAGSYAKIIPTLFGELVPFRPVSELVYPGFKNIGDIRRGKSQTIFRVIPLSGKPVLKFAVLICSESLYSHLAQSLGKSQAEAIFVLTNDAWFLSTNEATLHFDASAFRAAETGMPIAQASNNGVSGFLDISGRATASTKMDEITIISGDIRARSGATFFAMYGWLLMIGIVVASALMMGCLKLGEQLHKTKTSGYN